MGCGDKVCKFLSSIGLETNELNQIITNTKLQSIGDKNIYTVGDCGCVPWVGGPCLLFRLELKRLASKLSIYQINFSGSLMAKKVNPGDTSISVRWFPWADTVQLGV